MPLRRPFTLSFNPSGSMVSVVFGTPLVAFSLQAGMLYQQPMTLALCALGLAAIYAALAWALMSRIGPCTPAQPL